MSRSEEKAVALKYNSEQDLAPVVVASGYGPIAEKIIDIAETRGIPVYRDDSAASMLCMLDVGVNIPQELYEIVAAVYCQILTTASNLRQEPPAGAPPESSVPPEPSMEVEPQTEVEDLE